MATSNKKGPSPRRRPAQRSNNSAIVIAAVVGVAIVVGIIVAVVLGTSGDDDDDASTASLPTTPSGVAICDAGADTVATAPANDDAALAPFPADDIFKPVVVEGDALPALSDAIQQGAPDPALCTEAPVVSGYDYTGNEITIDPASDGATMVVLLAHWCPHCNREIPVLNEWRDSGDVPDNLNVVGVSTGVSADRDNYPPDEWLTSMDWQWPVLADGDISADDPADGADTAFRAYGGQSFPTMVIIGSNGEVLARFSAEAPVEMIQQIVDDALAQDAANTG